jgi:hypothetical protein
MGWLNDWLQGIPRNAVLKERIAFEEKTFKDMKAENKQLKEAVATLTAENEELKRQIADAPVATATAQPQEKPKIVNGLYYFDGDMSTAYCPRCYEREGKKHVMASMRHLGSRCTACGNTSLSNAPISR